MLNDRENILNALREKPLKVYEIMKRANVVNEESCQSLLFKNERRRLGEIRYSQRAMAYRLIRGTNAVTRRRPCKSITMNRLKEKQVDAPECGRKPKSVRILH
jgi:hypothetical protein